VLNYSFELNHRGFTMKVLGLVGSPRRASNTDLLVTAVLEGATTNNHITEIIYLYDMEIAPCIDCKVCKKVNYKCALKDDMQGLYSRCGGKTSQTGFGRREGIENRRGGRHHPSDPNINHEKHRLGKALQRLQMGRIQKLER
jgi:hypothetical protein